MKVTFEVDKSQTMTIPEVIEKVGVQKYCQKQMEGEPLIFSFTDEKGNGEFDLATGEVIYESGETIDAYEGGVGTSGILGQMDVSTLIWCETEDGETVAYIE